MSTNRDVGALYVRTFVVLLALVSSASLRLETHELMVNVSGLETAAHMSALHDIDIKVNGSEGSTLNGSEASDPAGEAPKCNVCYGTVLKTFKRLKLQNCRDECLGSRQGCFGYSADNHNCVLFGARLDPQCFDGAPQECSAEGEQICRLNCYENERALRKVPAPDVRPDKSPPKRFEDGVHEPPRRE